MSIFELNDLHGVFRRMFSLNVYHFVTIAVMLVDQVKYTAELLLVVVFLIIKSFRALDETRLLRSSHVAERHSQHAYQGDIKLHDTSCVFLSMFFLFRRPNFLRA